MVGKNPSGPAVVGLIAAFATSHSLLVTPCCSGPAPMIIDAQLGLLTVGMTPRAWNVQHPVSRIVSKFGVFAFGSHVTPRPSTPITTTCLTTGRAAHTADRDNTSASV